MSHQRVLREKSTNNFPNPRPQEKKGKYKGLCGLSRILPPTNLEFLSSTVSVPLFRNKQPTAMSYQMTTTSVLWPHELFAWMWVQHRPGSLTAQQVCVIHSASNFCPTLCHAFPDWLLDWGKGLLLHCEPKLGRLGDCTVCYCMQLLHLLQLLLLLPWSHWAAPKMNLKTKFFNCSIFFFHSWNLLLLEGQAWCHRDLSGPKCKKQIRPKIFHEVCRVYLNSPPILGDETGPKSA